MTTLRKGQKIGRLTLIEPSKRGGSWLCECSCADRTRKRIKTPYLQNAAIGRKAGATYSCGCLRREQMRENGKNSRTHGLSKDPRYKIYHAMIARCYDPTNPNYKYFGQLGAEVCQEWRDKKTGLETFARDMGYPPVGLGKLARIDPTKAYSKENCEWRSGQKQDIPTDKVKINGTPNELLTARQISQMTGQNELAVMAKINHCNLLGKVLDSWLWH